MLKEVNIQLPPLNHLLITITQEGMATLCVTATCCETASKKRTQWLASNIEYRYVIFNKNAKSIYAETININPFKLVTPSFSEAKLMEKLCTGGPIDENLNEEENA